MQIIALLYGLACCLDTILNANRVLGRYHHNLHKISIIPTSTSELYTEHNKTTQKQKKTKTT